MLKLMSVMHPHTACVKAISFTDEYPIMTSCALDGVICVFSIRGGYDRHQSELLAKFVNVMQIGGGGDLKYFATGITSGHSIVLNANVVFKTELAGKFKRLPAKFVGSFEQDD